MKVLFDYQAFTMQNYGGVSKCFCELIKSFPSAIQYEIAIKQSNNIHLKESSLVENIKEAPCNIVTFSKKFSFRGHVRTYYILNKYLHLPTAENINQDYSIRLLKENKYDIFHPTFFDPYFLSYIGNKPFVLTIHDMMPELFTNFFKRNSLDIINKRILAKSASKIIAVSNQTKSDIIDILKIPENKIEVIYHGGPQIEKIIEKPIFEKKYFLYVGQRGTYKNFPLTLKEFQKIAVSFGDVYLICTGPNFSKKETDLIKTLKLEHRVFQKTVTDKELKNLYANAIAFIYPSLYEGFGMPILEAYSYGCPVILNNTSCFPEIANNAALFFDSDDSSSNLSSKLIEILQWSQEERQINIKLGYDRLSYFSWNKSALKLISIYKEIING